MIDLSRTPKPQQTDPDGLMIIWLIIVIAIWLIILIGSMM